MRLYVVTVVVLVLLVHSATARSPGVLPKTKVPPEEYLVYNAIIADMFADNKITFDFGGKVTVKKMWIIDHTVGRPVELADWRARFPTMMVQTVDDYAVKNQQAFALERSFQLKMKYRLVDLKREDTQNASRYDLVTVSRVGFDQDHQQAFVYMTYTCGSVCGHGFLILLNKSDPAWRVEKKSQIWIS